MEIRNGEILVAPRTIFWVEMPEVIGEHDRVELLKNDIFIIRHSGDIKELVKLKEKTGKYSAFFYNLDGILNKNHIKHQTSYDFLRKVAKLIKSITPERAFVHTTIIDNRITELFRNEGIIYIEKNLYDKKVALQSMATLIQPFFNHENGKERSSVRLDLSASKYKVVMSKITDPTVSSEGCLKDLSVNGMLLLLHNKEDVAKYGIRNVIELKLHINNSILKISNAIVTRLVEETGEVGISYNINDGRMIREDYASYLTSLIYNWLKEVVKENGQLKSDNEELLKSS
jgi:hypothetical protein